jgi:hypothetical protein
MGTRRGGDLLAEVPQKAGEEVRSRPMACGVERKRGPRLLGRDCAVFPSIVDRENQRGGGVLHTGENRRGTQLVIRLDKISRV